MTPLFELSTQTENDIFTIVHLIAMSSTISNPILYGWLNTNLKHLFRAMIPYVRQERTASAAQAVNSEMNIAQGGPSAQVHSEMVIRPNAFHLVDGENGEKRDHIDEVRVQLIHSAGKDH